MGAGVGEAGIEGGASAGIVASTVVGVLGVAASAELGVVTAGVITNLALADDVSIAAAGVDAGRTKIHQEVNKHRSRNAPAIHPPRVSVVRLALPCAPAAA